MEPVSSKARETLQSPSLSSLTLCLPLTHSAGVPRVVGCSDSTGTLLPSEGLAMAVPQVPMWMMPSRPPSLCPHFSSLCGQPQSLSPGSTLKSPLSHHFSSSCKSLNLLVNSTLSEVPPPKCRFHEGLLFVSDGSSPSFPNPA